MKIAKLMPLLAMVALLGFSSCSKDSVEEETTIEIPSAPEVKVIEIEIMERINNHRISVGLNALSNNSVVKAVAFTHTDYMIEVDNISHDNFYKRQQSLKANANAKSVSENVAYGFHSAEAVVNAWLNSSGHKENIEGDFTHFDLSAEKNNEGKWYFTNMFIKK